MGCGMSRSHLHLLDEGFGSRTPKLQKINTDPMWLGSPSFRVYVQSDDAKGDQHTVIGGQNLICNRQVCVWEDANGKEVADKKGGRFRKAFHVHRVTFWHGGGPWHFSNNSLEHKMVSKGSTISLKPLVLHNESSQSLKEEDDGDPIAKE
ncbi:hypothetical protein L1987_45398 [Smallanthus sonchifolius]|uniref:Uncharacterized protein n=1 Tax=Smallanthus sonchifolius TaxID=185202 RepID=A0ACB9FWX9_9ASTR|nr:hypothetical protein L1987_45398 [Smallanthus sonchifolius]